MSDTSDNKMIEVGAFWKRTSKNGKKYLAGTLKPDQLPDTFGDGEKVKVVMFPNGNKDKDTKPDFYLYLSNLNNAPAPAPVSATEESPELEVKDENLL